MNNKKFIARYDDALPLFAALVIEHLGATAIDKHAFLRDADGTLTLILRAEIARSLLDRIVGGTKERLGNYVGRDPVATPSDLFDQRLRDPSHDLMERVQINGQPCFVRLIERRVIGQDWLRGIQEPLPDVPPIVVFASHKGGVGRSTALSVASAEFASRGKSILAIDLDLEAPGLGGLFLPTHDLPAFGVLDYFVESGRGSIDDGFLGDMLAISPLTDGRGQISIVPAVGQRCRDFPQNVIGKLSRAYLDDVGATATPAEPRTFLDQTRLMISSLCQRDRYDAVFVDARAGLNETTAAAVQGLGADVLFFGVDTPQTWEGYRYFFAHLARFNPQPGSEEDWRYRLRMIHAKAAANPKAWAGFRDRAFELFADYLYDEANESADETLTPFSFDLDDLEAPHYAWPIPIDQTYFEFDPMSHREQTMEPVYARTFGPFIRGLAERLDFE
jgi:Mrp family chromosome partitioning ATPase